MESRQYNFKLFHPFPLIVTIISMYINKYAIERMVNTRFIWSLESQRLFSEKQSGFVQWVILLILKRSRCSSSFFLLFSSSFFLSSFSSYFLSYYLKKKVEVYNTLKILHPFRSVAFRFHTSCTSIHRRFLSH